MLKKIMIMILLTGLLFAGAPVGKGVFFNIKALQTSYDNNNWAAEKVAPITITP